MKNARNLFLPAISISLVVVYNSTTLFTCNVYNLNEFLHLFSEYSIYNKISQSQF